MTEPTVKDSGERYENELGGVRDISEGKPDFKYVPFYLIKNIFFIKDDVVDFKLPGMSKFGILERLYRIRNEVLDDNFDLIARTIRSILILIGWKSLKLNDLASFKDKVLAFEKYSENEYVYFGLEKFALFMQKCAEKYSFENWKLLTTPNDIKRFKQSALSHYLRAICEREDEFHEEAAVFNLMGLMLNYQKFLDERKAD